jgi:hypothetical protein
MTKQHSPPTIQLTPDFLNSILRAFVEPKNATLLDVRLELLGEEGSYNAVLLRLYLTYDQPLTTGPKTLIAKLPTGQTELHERAAVFQPGLRENWFYRTGATTSPVQVPRCYFNTTDPVTGESVLLLDDLAPAQSGSWLAGASTQQAELALTSLARFHAYWWGREDRTEIQELNDLLAGNWDEEGDLVQDLFDEAWPRFLNQQVEPLPDYVCNLGDGIVGNLKTVDDLADQGPRTLTHGDYRLDNLLYGELDGTPTCWVIDWEDVFYGSGMIDLTWFIGGCLRMEDSHSETDLLKLYYQGLLDGGVDDYSWEDCYADYRRAMCSAFVQGVLSATLDEEPSDYDVKLAQVLSRRFSAAAQRLGLLEVMRS